MPSRARALLGSDETCGDLAEDLSISALLTFRVKHRGNEMLLLFAKREVSSLRHLYDLLLVWHHHNESILAEVRYKH